MLDRIYPETTQRQLPSDPLAPLLDILLNFRVTVVQVREHQIVVVAIFFTNILSPIFPISHDPVDSLLAIQRVVVYPSEMVPVVPHRAVLPATTWKPKTYPSFNLLR